MKGKNLQPWLEYFRMLQVYEERGFLEVKPQQLEAYITRAALLTLMQDGEQDIPSNPASLNMVLYGVRAYVGWRGQQGAKFLKNPFALHVVREEEPHDLMHTVLVTPRKHWWQRGEKVEVIEY